MKPFIRIVLLNFLFISITVAQDNILEPVFGNRIDLGIIENTEINEASGIAVSRKNTDVLWTHNDSGDPNRIFAFNLHGKHLGVYYIDGVGARDWEDMAVGPGPDPGKQYLYIGDIGDNNSQFELKYIYRVVEPEVDPNQIPVDTIIYGAEVITFKYPDGIHDAETIMVDPLNKDIYIVSKSAVISKVYRAPYPQSTTDTLILEYKITLDSTLYTGGDISPSGLEILIKTYFNIYYWYREPGEELWDALANSPLVVPYIWEPQGEAVGWEPKELGGYYTISEEILGIDAHLYFYPRLDSTTFITDNLTRLQLYNLSNNYPNPFNPSTKIKYSIPQYSKVQIKIYDVLGNGIKTIVNKEIPAGTYELTWNAENLPSGVYFYQLRAFDPSTGSGQVFIQTKKMLLMK